MAKPPSYHYVTHKESQEQGYRVAEGKFAGVVWTYRNVKLPIYDDDGHTVDPAMAEKLPLSFEYNVMYTPTDADLDTGEFASVAGDILLNIIDESLEHDQVQFNTENRNDDTE